MVEFDSSVPLRVLGNEVRYGQVVQNLVSNAIRYTDSGSVQVTVAADDQTLSLRVVDTGVGIAADELDTVFDPFVRVGSRNVRGTGLGLAIVQQLADVMDGSIVAESTLGVGSTFLFTIPCLPADDAPSEIVEHGLATQGTVLVVEDNEVNRTLAVKQLELIGLGTVTADSGDAALSYLESNTPDLILMDWNMPGISGLDAAQKIRERQLVPEEVPIVAMTANVLAGDRAACLAAGMNDHLAKPVSLDDMRSMMERWLAIREDADPSSEPVQTEGEADPAKEIRAGVEALLDDLGEVETVRVVIETYLDELSSRAQLLTATPLASPDEARRAAHTLRSTSALIGADRLAELCSEFEAAESPDQTLCERISDEIAVVEQQLTRLLDVGVAA